MEKNKMTAFSLDPSSFTIINELNKNSGISKSRLVRIALLYLLENYEKDKEAIYIEKNKSTAFSLDSSSLAIIKNISQKSGINKSNLVKYALLYLHENYKSDGRVKLKDMEGSNLYDGSL